MEESCRKQAQESFGIFADRVAEHYDNPQCNRRLYEENIARYKQNLRDWIPRLQTLGLMQNDEIYDRIIETSTLIAEMLACPTRFSAPSREPTTRSVAPSDPQ